MLINLTYLKGSAIMNLHEAWNFYGGLKLSDVAGKLGVSEAFVSQVLSGSRSSSQVTTEIRMQIEKRIKELKENLCGTNTGPKTNSK